MNCDHWQYQSTQPLTVTAKKKLQEQVPDPLSFVNAGKEQPLPVLQNYCQHESFDKATI